jgi:hypothetical protein
MADRKVLIVLGAVGAAGLVAFLWVRRAAAAAKVGTQMVVTTPPPSSVGQDQDFTFSGYLEDVHGTRLAGKHVRLMIDGSEAMSMNTGSDGTWGFGIKINATGTRTMYAEFPGDEGYAGCNI